MTPSHHASLAVKLVLVLVVLALAALAAGCTLTLQRSAAPLALEKDTPTAAHPTASAPASTLPGTQNLLDWQLYRDERHGFELLVPPDGVVVAAAPDQSRIDLPIRPGTNLQEKYLLIDVQPGDARCQSSLAVGYSPEALQVSQVEIGEQTFTLLSGSEGAAGNFYDWSGYSTANPNVCISLTFVLHSMDAYNFETPLPEFDRHRESDVFGSILASFRWQQ